MTLIYATADIEDFMNRPENYPELAMRARDHIRSIHEKYAPSNIYDPKTFDHMKEIKVRQAFVKRDYFGIPFSSLC